MTRGLSVIIPALDEEAHVAAAVREVLAAAEGRFGRLDLLLFDDGSRDRTGDIMDRLAALDPRLRVVHNPSPRNLGGVYKQGIAMARCEFVVMVPGDNENPASALEGPFDAVGLADIVLPYPEADAARSLGRSALSRGYTALVNALFSLDAPYFNGTVVHRTELVRSVPIRTDSFAYQAEALVRLLERGHSFVPVPIRVVPREGRRSKALRPRNVAGVLTTIARLFWELRIGRVAESPRGQ
ncbi:MAG: glycosyltransferase family 2 protein [Polyangiaceae bacterium]|nr:glycosyltransferase family 2 protein [Polyangiaceae bacterium]